MNRLASSTVLAAALVGCAQAPQGLEITLGAESLRTGDDLVATIAYIPQDPHRRDPVVYDYAWYQDGVLREGLVEDTVPAALTEKGETWRVVVTPLVGRAAGPPAEATVRIANTAPVAELRLSARGDLVAAATASDPDGDPVALSYAWTRDGAPTDLTSATVPASLLARGERWEVVVTATDGEDAGSPARAAVVVGNVPPRAAKVQLSPRALRTGTDVVASAELADDDGDTITPLWTWYVDDAIVQQGESATLSGTRFRKGQQVRAVLIPSDAFESGAPVASATVVVDNAPPTLAGAAVTPSAATVASTLECLPVGGADLDGDALTYDVAWTVDGAPASTASTLAGIAKGKVVACTLTPFDGESEGIAVTSAAITVGNTPPTLQAATLSDLAPRAGDTLSVSVEGGHDVDGDPVGFSYVWLVDGQPAGTGATFAGFARGDVVQVQVTPTDGTADGPPVTSPAATVANTLPVVTSAELGPVGVTTDGTLLAAATATDADGDLVELSYAWTVDGQPVPATGPRLDGSWFGKGDTVRYSVTPSDAFGSGPSAASSAVVVANAAPTLAGARITPASPTAASALDCLPVDGADADGDTLAYQVVWTVNGAIASTAVPLVDVPRGSVVTCELTPFDGEAHGEPRTSAAVTIDNTAPTLQAATLSTLSPRAGDVLSVTAVGPEDLDGDPVDVSYEWHVNGVVAGTGPTLTDFSRGDVVQAWLTPHDGTTAGEPVPSAAPTVVNSPPTVVSATLGPQGVTTAGTLLASTVTFDADGDPVELFYEWTVAGLVVPESSAQLDGSWFQKGDEVRVHVTPTDAQGEDGDPVASNAVVVANSAPTAPALSISPAAPLSGDALVCQVDADSFDADGDLVTYTFAWEVDGQPWLGQPGTTTFDGDTVPAAVTLDGESWTCVVSPDDGEAVGPAGEATVAMPDGPPEILGSYSAAGITVYRVSEIEVPATDAPGFYQQVCTDLGLRPVSCDPAVYGADYDASAWNAIELPSADFSCNVSSGIASLTGWSNLLTFHMPGWDPTGVLCGGGYCEVGMLSEPVCGEYDAIP